MDMTFEENERTARDEVKSALDRPRAGTYGVRTRCGAEIPAARLEAMPAAMLHSAKKTKSVARPGSSGTGVHHHERYRAPSRSGDQGRCPRNYASW
jgi:hypothetical protein